MVRESEVFRLLCINSNCHQLIDEENTIGYVDFFLVFFYYLSMSFIFFNLLFSSLRYVLLFNKVKRDRLGCSLVSLQLLLLLKFLHL